MNASEKKKEKQKQKEKIKEKKLKENSDKKKDYFNSINLIDILNRYISCTAIIPSIVTVVRNTGSMDRRSCENDSQKSTLK